ncbi:hypothetical protein ACTXT7_002595 [Hymenolepis weldensis]
MEQRSDVSLRFVNIQKKEPESENKFSQGADAGMRSGSGKECDEVESVEVGMLMEGIGRGWMWCGELEERRKASW